MKIKNKKCANIECGKMFRPHLSTQRVCSYYCSLKYAKQKSEAKNNLDMTKSTKELKESIMTLSDWLQKLQKDYFNPYIRERDKLQTCISCHTPLNGRKFDAGHYRSVGSTPELRFDEMNVHGQCVKCNQHLHGNLIEYRKKLIKRIGLEQVERLEGPNEPRHYSIPEIKELIKEYKIKIKQIKDNLLDL